MKNELLELLNKAKNELNNHPKGELILPIRKSILKHLGEHLENSNEHALINNGLKRRIKLAVLCVEYVMPIWNEVAPEDTTPQDLIKSIDTYLLGKVEWKTLWNMQNSFWTTLENYSMEARFKTAAYVGFAAINAVVVALFDEETEELDDDGNVILDQDLDLFTWDTSFYAAAAYSENEPEENKIQKRREFWLWYLNDAVPLAYQAAKD